MKSSFYEGVKILVSLSGGANINSHCKYLETPLYLAITCLANFAWPRAYWIHSQMEERRTQMMNRRGEEESVCNSSGGKDEEVAWWKCTYKMSEKGAVSKQFFESDKKMGEERKRVCYERGEKMLLDMENKLKIVEFLLATGANPNIATKRNDTPLHAASRLPEPLCYHVVHLLLQAGAKPNVRNLEGQTPLMVACKADYDSREEAFDLLIQVGADTSVVDKEGMGCLFHMVGASDNSLSCVQTLLEMDDRGVIMGDSHILHEAIRCLSCTFSPPEREQGIWEKQALIIELILEKGACPRTPCLVKRKQKQFTAFEHFVIVVKEKSPRRDWEQFLGPSILQIGLALGQGSTQLEKDFLNETIREDGQGNSLPLLSHLSEQLEVFYS